MIARTSGFVVALMVGGAALAAAETKNIDRTLPLSAAGTVSLSAHNGSIVIRTWDRPQVEVHVRVESRGSSSIARYRLNEIDVEVDGSPDHVSINTRIGERSAWGLWSLFGGDWVDAPELFYNITAPKGASWRIRDHNAKAEIRDVNGALDVATHNGAIRVLNLTGPIDLSMHNGYANIDVSSFTHASRISTHNGTVEMSLPAASKFDLRSRGHNMRVQSDFPVSVRASDFGRHDVSGSANGGGPELQLNAHNGSFRLRSK